MIGSSHWDKPPEDIHQQRIVDVAMHFVAIDDALLAGLQFAQYFSRAFVIMSTGLTQPPQRFTSTCQKIPFCTQRRRERPVLFRKGSFRS